MPSEFPPKYRFNTRGPIVLGILCLLITFGGFGGWAATARISSAVVAPGTLTFETKRKRVKHLEGGIIESILVRDGDRVRRGDVLIKLDEARAKADLAILRGAYDAAVAHEARLIAERDSAMNLEFPESLIARRNEKGVREVLSGQRSLFWARRESRDGEIDLLNQRVDQLETQITGLQAQQKAKKRQIALITEELRALQELFEKGHTTKPRILALERNVARLAGERGELIAETARTRTAIGETRLRALQLETEFREKVVEELRDVQTEIYDLRERMAAARHVLDHIEIRAPVSGNVVAMKVHAAGEVVRSGETIMEIAPQEDRLVVEVKTRPIDIDSLSLGLEADVYFTAFTQRSTPAITGRVVYISADSLRDKPDGKPFYVVRIAVDDEQIGRLGDRTLQSGMPAEVAIKTGVRTPVEYLAQPVLDSMKRAWREN